MADTKEHPGTPDLLASLRGATQGLLFPSESDAPVIPFVWDAPGGQKELTADSVRRLSGHGAADPIEETTLRNLFQRVTTPADWHKEIHRERIRKFTALEKLLTERLRGIRVFRIGTISIDVYVVGVDEQDRLAGVSTNLVET